MSKAFQFNGTSYVSSLPFINTQTGNWFDVTPTGDAKTDYNIGINCAVLLLKAMADDNKNLDYKPLAPNTTIILPKIAKSMIEQGESLQETASGFFFMLDVLVQSFAPKLNPEISNYSHKLPSYDSLIAEINPVIH